MQPDGTYIFVGEADHLSGDPDYQNAGLLSMLNPATGAIVLLRHLNGGNEFCFNDVIAPENQLFYTVGTSKRIGCGFSDGLILKARVKVQVDASEDEASWSLFTLNRETYFYRISKREDGNYVVKAVIDFLANAAPNETLNVSGPQDVTIVFDKDLNYITGLLKDGREFTMSPIADDTTCL